MSQVVLLAGLGERDVDGMVSGQSMTVTDSPDSCLPRHVFIQNLADDRNS